MTMANGERTYQLKALTDLWTGSVTLEEKKGQIKEKTGSDRLITTGLLGSIRWWFEVLVRGLGGSACDPSDTKCEDRNHCVVCELFGCTGWARKFRFEVLDENGNIREIRDNAGTKISPQIMKGEKFSLSFTPLRPICPKEWALLDATLRLIADYGAIGGKTVFKPTNEPNRTGETHHKDYGIVEILKINPPITNLNVAEVEKYVCEERWRKPEAKRKDADFSWASLENFWCVNGKYLARQDANSSSFNRVIRRPEPKSQSKQNDSWLAGRRPDKEKGIEPESKKVFSFMASPRTFGFVEKADSEHWNKIKDSLMNLKNVVPQWHDFNFEKQLLTKNQILVKLFKGEGRV